MTDSLSLIHATLQPELTEMNRIIREFLYTPNQLMNSVVETYLQTKGKQVRPIMVILSAGLFGDVNDCVLHAGAALEMLHNASLIHDDVVDETLTRRNRPTINNLWSNQIAVLAGDFFVSNALSCAITTGNINIIASLSDLGRELSLGEIDQICNAQTRNTDEQAYLGMIRRKTASLFINCAKIGAEGAGAAPESYQPLLQFAELLGLCFQIKDDIFDYYSDAAIGKPTGNDLREGKVSLPLLHALNTAPDAGPMKELLGHETLTADEIDTLITFAKDNGGIDYAYSRMADMQRRALRAIDVYPDSKWRRSLIELLDYIITRPY